MLALGVMVAGGMDSGKGSSGVSELSEVEGDSEMEGVESRRVKYLRYLALRGAMPIAPPPSPPPPMVYLQPRISKKYLKKIGKRSTEEAEDDSDEVDDSDEEDDDVEGAESRRRKYGLYLAFRAMPIARPPPPPPPPMVYGPRISKKYLKRIYG